MPELVRLYIRHVLIGFVLGLAFTGLLLWLNVGNLWHLVNATDAGVVAVVMLVVFNTIVFSGVQFAFAVMGLARHDDHTGGKLVRVAAPQAVPIEVESGGDRSNRAGLNFPRA